MKSITIERVRRIVVAAQGYRDDVRTAGTSDVVDVVRRLSCVQLDSISALARSHRIVIAARVGRYDEKQLSKLLAKGRLFEYWAHAACLLPIEDYALLKARMSGRHPWYGDVIAEDPDLAEHVIETLRERGPLGSRHFEGRNAGSWWEWKPAKRMLEALWTSGQIAIAGRQGFQRVYDLAERVIPKEHLEAAPLAEKDYVPALILRALQARGALTEGGIVEHYRFRRGLASIRPHVKALIKEGSIAQLEVDDGGPPVLVPAHAALDVEPRTAVLLSPFDNLLWDRAFVERVFDFHHRVEFYKKQPDRIYGYYVLPFLMGDRLVGRADLKADRANDAIEVKALHLEPGVRKTKALKAAFDRALDRLVRTIL